MGFSFFLSMILGLMDVRFSLTLSLSIIQFSRWVIDVDQEMSILEDLWEECGGFVLCKFFFSVGMRMVLFLSIDLEVFERLRGKKNHAIFYPLGEKLDNHVLNC